MKSSQHPSGPQKQSSPPSGQTAILLVIAALLAALVVMGGIFLISRPSGPTATERAMQELDDSLEAYKHSLERLRGSSY